eukprot:2275583-Pleurochrysis_carterae.AAC.7
MGEYVCTIIFSDERVGEFSIELRATSTLPSPLETLRFSTQVSTSQSKDVALAFRNPQLERARSAVLDRSLREKERMLALWGKEPLVKGPLTLSLASSSPFFAVPSTVDLVETKSSGNSTASRRASTSNNTAPSTAVATPKDGKSANSAPPNANKLDVRFVPKASGIYSGQLLLSSPLDVRVYELHGTGNAPNTKASLEFTTPARQPVVQELPVVNGMDVDWTVSASLKGEGFSGPPSIKVAPKTTATYPLQFTADWVCQREGELTLHNNTTGDKYVYALKAVAEEPLAEGHLVLQCAARQPQALSFKVHNVSASGDACALTVDSDLLHVSGAPTIDVPARGKGQLARREERTYELTVNPQLGGIVHGSITFSAPDGRYLWYTVELRAAPPPAEGNLEISAPLRKVVAVEIPIMNPSAGALEFEVSASEKWLKRSMHGLRHKFALV